MRYKLLGRSGLRVSELSLGTMTFGEDWGWGASRDESRKIFDAFVRAGGNFIDTACNYTNGSSERLVGEFVASDRDRFVVATKYSLTARPSDPNGGGNHRKNLLQSLHGSLKRLGTEHIDLLWLHAWDFLTPVDEIMRALDDVVRAGKVGYIGISDTPAWIVSQANMLADLRGWSPFVGLQIQYSLIERTPERDLLPMAKALDLGVTSWGALGSGVLTGKYKAGEARPSGARLASGPWSEATLTERNLGIGQVVADVAKDLGKSPSQVAISFVLHQQARAQMIPILGARTVRQLDDNLGALTLPLGADQLAKLDAASRIELGFPHAFLQNADGFLFGEVRPLIDTPTRR